MNENEELKKLSVIYVRKTGNIHKYGEKEDIERYYNEIPNLARSMCATFSFENYPREDAYIMVQYVLTHAKTDILLHFVIASEAVRLHKLSFVKKIMEHTSLTCQYPTVRLKAYPENDEEAEYAK